MRFLIAGGSLGAPCARAQLAALGGASEAGGAWNDRRRRGARGVERDSRRPPSRIAAVPTRPARRPSISP